MTKYQLIEKAKELIYQAQELVEEAIQGTGAKAHYEAYGKYGFNQLLGDGNPYDKSLEDLMNDIGSDGPYNPDNADGSCHECGTRKEVSAGYILCESCIEEYESGEDILDPTVKDRRR